VSVLSPPIATPASRPSGPGGLRASTSGSSRRSQRLGVMYVLAGLAFFGDRGARASVSAGSSPWPANRRLAAGLQPALHRARDHDGVPGGHPDLFGFANYLVPLMIGARDLAFPRLTLRSGHSCWRAPALLQLSGRGRLYGAGSAPDVGWFAYAPLTGGLLSGHSTDYWNLSSS